MLADQAVKAATINWESIAVVATAVLAIVGSFTTWVGNRITHAINDLKTELVAKLETKDVVNGINIRLSVLESKVSEVHTEVVKRTNGEATT